MTEFGKTLREAREQKGLTIGQIAEQTHLLPQIVEDLENEDFHRISAPIYGRGFVKLYCETVGLEPKPLVDEFMAILNGERAPAIRVKEVALPEEPATPVEPPPPPPPVYTQPELGEDAVPRGCNSPNCTEPGEGAFRRNAPTETAQVETRDASVGQDARPETRDAGEDARRETPPAPPQPRQYHPDYAQSVPPFGRSVNFGRLAILAGGAIALFVLLFFGIRAVYRASMGITVDAASSPRPDKATEKAPAKPVDAISSSRPDKATEKASAKPVDAAPSPRPRTPRTPKTVPPLYID